MTSAPTPPAAGLKAAQRQEAKRRRAAMTPADRALASRQIAASVRRLLPPGPIFIYVALELEVATRSLLNELVADGVRVAVPRIVARDHMVAVEFPGWSAMEEAELGILRPPSREPFPDAFVAAIVPGLAFSRAGARLGYGAGFYDRWFAAHPEVLRIGITFESLLFDSLVCESHDMAMHYIVTEQQCLDLRPT